MEVKTLGVVTKTQTGDKMMSVRCVEITTRWIKEDRHKAVDKVDITVVTLSKIVDEIKSSIKSFRTTMKAVIKQKLITKCVTISLLTLVLLSIQVGPTSSSTKW